MAYRKIKARKNRGFTEPVDWFLRPDNRAVIHTISNIELVMTQDGIMMLAEITSVGELCRPDCNVAMLIGNVKVLRKSGIVDTVSSPELWFYDENFWVNARSPDGTPHVVAERDNNGAYFHRRLMYTVEVADVEKLSSQLITGFEPSKDEPDDTK